MTKYHLSEGSKITKSNSWVKFAMEEGQILCNYCNFVCNGDQVKMFFKHLVQCHSNLPNFKVYCVSCPQSFTKVNSLQKHYYRHHRDQPEQPVDDGAGKITTAQQALGGFKEVNAREALKRNSAKFLLCAKEEGKLSQTALEIVMSSTTNLVDEYLDIVNISLLSKLADDHQEIRLTEDMVQLFSADNLFDGLANEYQQKSYYQQNFNLVVSTLLYIFRLLQLHSYY